MRRVLFMAIGLMFLSAPACALLAVAGAGAGGTAGGGEPPVGILEGAAVPEPWQAAEAAVGCPEVPLSVVGALGFLASGSGRWLDRPPPWASSPEGPLGIGASTGPLSSQIARSMTTLCWLTMQQDLASAIASVAGGPRWRTVIGVLAAALEDTPLLSASRARAVSFAAEAIGLPYRWGGNGPDAYDCSGLMVAAWASAGVALPRVAQDQHDHLGIPGDQGLPGDLVFYGSGSRDVSHVGMWIRAGLLLDAPYTGAFVRLDPMDLANAVSIGRVR